MFSDDLPTLRLVTLRRLLAKAAPPLVFHVSTNLAALEAALRASPSSIAILVDRDHVLRRTASLADAACGGVTAQETPVLAPENDVDAAYLAMFTYHADRVLVVDASGELLGVLTERELRSARRHSAA